MRTWVSTVMLVLAMLFSQAAKAQSNTSSAQTKLSMFDGILVLGYTDHGAYLNCTGPAVKFTRKPYLLMLGLLPGLRIKKDKVAAGATENSVITPSLGFGLTAAYRHLVLQLPLYYNAKTAVKDGQWHPGIGLGYKF